MRYPRADADHVLAEARRRLLDAAAEQIAREGYEGANVNRISISAGFAKGTIYNYFASKQTLMESLLQSIAEHHCSFVAEHVRQGPAAETRLAGFFEAGFEFARRYPAQARVAITTVHGSNLAFKTTLYLAYQPLFELIAAEIIACGVAEGVFRELDPAATARLLMTLYLGSVSEVDDRGRLWLSAADVSGFAWHALRVAEP